MHHRSQVLAWLSVLVLLAACGGGTATGGGTTPGAATQAPVATSDGEAPESTPSAANPAPVDEPTAAPSSDAGAGSGGAVGSVCDLVTVAELEKAFVVSGVQAELFVGPPDTCGFKSGDGTPLGAIVYSSDGGAPVFDAIHQGAGITDFQGIGDRAYFAPEMQMLLVLKGDALLTVTVTAADDEEQRQELAKAIAALAAARM
jgi:hypothetical protein